MGLNVTDIYAFRKFDFVDEMGWGLGRRVPANVREALWFRNG
jgi:hypothetical protein